MGSPQIHAREIPCYLCEDFPCIEACPTLALEPVAGRRDVTMGIAVIDQSICFPYNGIICRACYERCPIYGEAIILESELYPKVVEKDCVGCGICEHVCPTEPKSIFVKSAHP
jgi:NAD-dependent dihydropyrimidine dehydrogenase PreA subunit